MMMIPEEYKKEQKVPLTYFTSNNCYTNSTLAKNFVTTYSILSKKFGCSYFSYILECQKTIKKIRLSTNKTWAEYYYFKNLIQSCPVAETIRKLTNENFLTNNTLIWDYISPETRKAKLINGIRSEFDIAHGITFSTFLLNPIFGYYLEMITFTGERLDLHFYNEILQNKQYINSLLYPLRCQSYIFLTKTNTNHLNNNIKSLQ